MFDLRSLVAACMITALTVACGGGGEGAKTQEEKSSLTVYSGRNESLIQPILDRFAEQSGIEVKVRYGGTAEMAATLMEEGAATPADVFISQDAAALAAVAASEAGLQPLPEGVRSRVAPRFQDPDGRWVGLSGRVRVVVYNTEMIKPEELPTSLEGATGPQYKGKFGIAPTNGSLQAHLAAYRVLVGDEGLNALLVGIAANEPEIYPKNSAIVEAVAAGEVAWGLVNHYYLWRHLSENPEAPAANFTMTEGPAASFVNMAGLGIVKDTPAARQLAEFLLSDEAQGYFAKETFEYPLVASVASATELPPLADFGSLDQVEVDFAAAAAELEPTLTAIRESGLLP